MLSAFLRFERIATRIALIAAAVFLALTAALVLYQVIMRFVIGDPSTWSAVASRTFMIWSVFLGAAYTFRTGEMLRVEVIHSIAPKRLHFLIECLTMALCVLFFALVLYLGVRMGFRVSSQTLAGMNISIAWAYAALPVGAAFAIIGILGRFAEQLLTPDTNTADKHAPETGV